MLARAKLKERIQATVAVSQLLRKPNLVASE
jgi:hypothetical protein